MVCKPGPGPEFETWARICKKLGLGAVRHTAVHAPIMLHTSALLPWSLLYSGFITAVPSYLLQLMRRREHASVPRH